MNDGTTYGRLTALIAAALVASLAALYSSIDYRFPTRIELDTFRHLEGAVYAADVPASIPSDTGAAWNSPLRLFEDEAELGPAHFPPSLIENRGRGAYVHYDGQIQLSASDNSNPNENGHRYTVTYPGRIPFGGLLGLGLLLIVLRPHPYMSYTLNPDALINGERQINDRFYIRRREPVRDRRDVSWRGLAVGGSTTQDIQIMREQDTWVYRVEEAIRARCGPALDFVNGGVGGYTIYENFIHYVTLLTYLDPDVVVLYVGTNDVNPRLIGTLENDYRNYTRPAWNAEAATLRHDTSRLRYSSMYRLWRFIAQYDRLINAGIGGLVRYARPDVATWEAALERNGTEVYENALTNFVQLILGQGRRVILVPQYHQSRAGADRPGRRGVAEIDRVFGQAVAEHNAVTRRVSSSFNLPYLSAIETRPPFVRSDLNDSMHFNRWGAEKMADLVYRFLVDETDALAGQATCHGG